MNRTITATDLFIAVNRNGEAHIFGGDEPKPEENGTFVGMLLAYLGPSRLYGLVPGECRRILLETTERTKIRK